MRKTILDQSKDFILENTRKNNFIFSSIDIKTTIKNFLIENKYLYSPIKNIFILKKNNEDISEKLNNNKFKILEKLCLEKNEIISGEFLIDYYLGNTKFSKIFRIITKSKNFESFLGEEKNNSIKFIFKPSKVPRISKKIKIENSKLIIETKLSFIINNYFLFKDNENFQKVILETDFNLSEIENLIEKKFKFSTISKLAIFYKNKQQVGKYNIIMQAIKNKGKKIDRRGTKVVKNEKIKKKVNVDLNNLF